MSYNNQKIQLEETPFIRQASPDSTRARTMIKVWIRWQYRIMNMYRGQRNLRKRDDIFWI